MARAYLGSMDEKSQIRDNETSCGSSLINPVICTVGSRPVASLAIQSGWTWPITTKRKHWHTTEVFHFKRFKR